MSTKPAIAVIGTCDTKLEALTYIKDTIISSGRCNAILVDIGSYDPPDSQTIDISRSTVLNALGDKAVDTTSRNSTLDAMTQALTLTLSRLRSDNYIAGVIAAGGSGNTSVCTKAFREALPIGFPKLMVSTMASGNTSHYVGETDLTMMYSVADVAGMNNLLRTILGNAADAIEGMAVRSSERAIPSSTRPAIAVTMFGLTTPCVQIAIEKLEELGYSTVVFHATGAGGLAMERLIREGHFVGVLDLTTTELADELVGGVLTAGPNRLEAAGEMSIPQVISVGAMDMVNFGPPSTIPEKFNDRLFNNHNFSVTLMRTSKEECSKLGEILIKKLSKASPTKTRIILPRGGFSGIDKEGGPFYDMEADQALFDVLQESTLQCHIQYVDSNINDPCFAHAAASALVEMLRDG
ncbi:hypothetical protein BJ138DRAFT_1142159 [Hygrophoropsis aurantiaca]|uniref:Uncharacterized protein n=1 Tax=Hygrophoropsis aurantiaca TaxID=72124 RepID=A0ACB8AQ57_9AGAM|nr:hypothetical protein BJ138DRAFT_1142159 [Hygrophoropsis aurantiaca]